MTGAEAAVHQPVPAPRTATSPGYDATAWFPRTGVPPVLTGLTSGNLARAPQRRSTCETRDSGARRQPLVSTDELAILRLVAEGLPIDAVAHRLDTSPRTVRRRMRNLCDRIGATCTIQAVVWAARRDLV
jgi:DNA-binding NarL/FixJ family response regulator